MKKLFVVLAVLPFLLSCGGDDDKVDTSIKLNKTEYVLNFEDKVQIEATSINTITYTSESEYVAMVSASGLITAGRIGDTNLFLITEVIRKQ